VDGRGLKFTIIFVAALYVEHVVELLLTSGTMWSWLGILPRTFIGLRGMLFAPVLHGSWRHLLVNTGPLLILLALLFTNRRYRPWSSFAWLWVLSGFGTWLIGRGGQYHIGASGLICALAAFLVVAAWRVRQWRAVLVAVAVIALYGGLVLAAVPWNTDQKVSWESHLSGLLAGAVVASRLRRPRPDPVEEAARKALEEADRLEKLAVEVSDRHRERRT
jgi:membrane associated rhomboid family serine protease